MITIPKALQSSDGTGTLSRTITGLAGVIVFVGAMYSPLTEIEIAELINQGLLVVSSVWVLYGLIKKMINKTRRVEEVEE